MLQILCLYRLSCGLPEALCFQPVHLSLYAYCLHVWAEVFFNWLAINFSF